MDMKIQAQEEMSKLLEYRQRLNERNAQKNRASGKTKKSTGKTNRAGQKKKKLNYNAWEISNQIMQAVHSSGASRALMRARSKMEYLQRCAASGNYDEEEVRAAVVHAERMVACAQKKVENLKAEEQMQKSSEGSGDRQRVQQKAEQNRERMQLKRQLEEVRRRHREDENKELQDADIQYLKAKVRNQERQEAQLQAELAEAMMPALSAEALGEMPSDAAMAGSAATSDGAGTEGGSAMTTGMDGAGIAITAGVDVLL